MNSKRKNYILPLLMQRLREFQCLLPVTTGHGGKRTSVSGNNFYSFLGWSKGDAQFSSVLPAA